MKRYLLQTSYDGNAFSGWQYQKEDRTVQQVIENALSEIAKKSVKITCAGRTDAGVHALRQYAHFDFNQDMNAEQIKFALQAKLPADVSVQKVFAVIQDFNARYDASSRTYKYLLTKQRTPFNRYYKSFLPKKHIREKIIRNCLLFFLGKHDFTSFSKYNPDLNNYFCKITQLDFIDTGNEYIFTISANRFLHNMVRRIVGTVINISHFELEPEIIRDLIAAKDQNNKLIETAPPQGLYLAEVEYPKDKFV
jgi:tRNA pseudouridine38-40 synthase